MVTFKTDKKKYNTEDLCIPVDSTWTITMSKDTSDTTLYFVKAEKTFHNANDINEDYKKVPNSFSGIKREISFKKKFMLLFKLSGHENHSR